MLRCRKPSLGMSTSLLLSDIFAQTFVLTSAPRTRGLIFPDYYEIKDRRELADRADDVWDSFVLDDTYMKKLGKIVLVGSASRELCRKIHEERNFDPLILNGQTLTRHVWTNALVDNKWSRPRTTSTQNLAPTPDCCLRFALNYYNVHAVTSLMFEIGLESDDST